MGFVMIPIGCPAHLSSCKKKKKKQVLLQSVKNGDWSAALRAGQSRLAKAGPCLAMQTNLWGGRLSGVCFLSQRVGVGVRNVDFLMPGAA